MPATVTFWRSPWPVRIGLLLVVGVYIAYSLFGVAAPFLWGHHGYHGATYMLRAIMSLRFHLLLPTNWAGYDYPPRFSWYLHHPIGYHHFLTLLIPIFGVHEWVARGAAAFGGLFVLWGIYAVGKRLWSREAALLAVFVWVTLPFVCSFSVLSDPMFPEMSCFLLVLYAWFRYWEQPSRKWLAWACAGLVMGGFLMWEVYFEAAYLGIFAMALLLSRKQEKPRLGRYSASLVWTFWTGLFSSLTMASHFVYTWSKGMIGDMHGSYNMRRSASFDYAYSHQKQWLELLYGWPLVTLGVAWLLWFIVRWVAGRARRRDQAVLIFFVINTFYLFVFAEAAAVHEYRVFFYSGFFAFAIADFATELYGGIVWLGEQRLGGRFSTRIGMAAAAAVLIFIVGYARIELPHSWHNLIESREIMGTHGQVNYDSDYSKQLFAMEAARRSGKEDFFIVDNNMPRRIEFYYYLDRSNWDINSLVQVPAMLKDHPRALLLMDVNTYGAEHTLMVELLKHHPGLIFDRYLLIDLRSDAPSLHAYQWQAQPMSRAYRYFVSHKYPPMKPREVRPPLLIQIEKEIAAPPPQPPLFMPGHPPHPFYPTTPAPAMRLAPPPR